MCIYTNLLTIHEITYAEILCDNVWKLALEVMETVFERNVIMKRILLLTLLVNMLIGFTCCDGCLIASKPDQISLGDWYLELMSEYRLNRVNKYEIIIEKKAPQGGGINVIENYFVKKYAMTNQVILLEGIPTADWFISEQEMADGKLLYYWIDIDTDTVFGPFETKDILYDRFYLTYGHFPDMQWIEVKDPPTRQ